MAEAKGMLETLQTIEETADRAMRDDDYRRWNYLDEIKALACAAIRRERAAAAPSKDRRQEGA